MGVVQCWDLLQMMVEESVSIESAEAEGADCGACGDFEEASLVRGYSHSQLLKKESPV